MTRRPDWYIAYDPKTEEMLAILTPEQFGELVAKKGGKPMANESVLEAMDEAAELARQEFMDEVILKRGTAKDTANWLKRHYKSAGYKRLSKILVEYAD